MTTAAISCEHSCPPAQTHAAPSRFQKIMRILEVISFIALTCFAAYTCPKLFFPAFGCGTLIGLYVHWKKISTQSSQHTHPTSDHDASGCSLGFIEQLTGVRLPAPLGLAANVAMTACHIGHHPSVFAPLIGLNAGMWVGKWIIEVSTPHLHQVISGS